MDKSPKAERDTVRDLREDAQWSMWTNSIERWRGRQGGGHLARDPGVRTFMLAALLVAGIIVGAIGVAVLLLKLT